MQNSTITYHAIFTRLKNGRWYILPHTLTTEFVRAKKQLKLATEQASSFGTEYIIIKMELPE